jgi:hypothetical protein
MRNPEGARPLVAAGVIVPASAGVAVAAVVPVWGGPPGTTGLVALLAFAMALMTGIAASGAPAGEPAARHPAARHPAVHEEGGPLEQVLPDEPDLRPGRCFGCVRLGEVTEAGVLARGGVQVPLYVCASCLEHLEAWHTAQVAAIGARQAIGAHRIGAGLAG